MLPSLDTEWKDSPSLPPRIFILEVRHEDRPDSSPSDWLLVERQEQVDCLTDGSPAEARIRISFRKLNSTGARGPSECGFFDGRYSKGLGEQADMVSLTGGAIMMPYPMRGKGIGTFFMNEIVKWAKQWPDAEVRRISLSPVDGSSENKDRRNRFYEQFGLRFSYSDPDLRGGVSKPMLVSGLHPVDALKGHIQILTVSDFIGTLIRETEALRRQVADQSSRVVRIQGLVDQATKKPLRWAVRLLWARISVWVSPIALLLGVGYAVYKWLSQP